MSLPSPKPMTDQQTLRRHLKQARRGLNPDAAARAQRATLQRLRQLPCYRRARRIAAYVGSGGEIDPLPLLSAATHQRKRVYLPVLHPFRPGRLWFCRWQPGERLVPNRYGIPEPVRRRDHILPARRLDLVIVPLLGFDTACNRLGMGGGYYDRTFAFLNQRRHIHRPLLIGLAHELQCVESLDPQPWDVSLDVVVTAQRIYRRDDT